MAIIFFRMEEAWRQLFNSRNQSVLVDLLIYDYFPALKFLYEKDEISKSVYEDQLKEIQEVRGRDLTVAFRLLGRRFSRISGERPGSLRINMQSFYFQKKAAGGSKVALGEIEAHSERLRVTDPLFTLLKEARNVDAHDLSEQPAYWNTMVLSCVLYLLDVSRVSEKLLDDAKALKMFVSNQLNASNVVPDKTQTPKPPTNTEVLAELRSLRGLISSEQENTNQKPEDAQPSLTEAEFESRLLELKRLVLEEFEDDYWPGPMANLFQRSFVSEVMKYKPNNLNEAIRLPDVAWRVDKNRSIVHKQINRFGEEFDALIKRVKWEDDDIDVFEN